MDHIGILKRAYHVAVKYPILWVFGFFATTGGGIGARFPTSWNFDHRGPLNFPWGRGKSPDEFFRRLLGGLSSFDFRAHLAIFLGVIAFFLILFLIWIVLHYVAETGLYRSVFGLEESGERPTWYRGWHLGWSCRALHVFLVDLVVFLTMAFVIALSVIAGIALFMGLSRGGKPGIGTIIPLILFGLAGLLVVLVALIVFSLVDVLARIRAAVSGQGVLDGIAWAWEAVTNRWQDIGIMWLLMVGVAILWGLVIVLAMIVLALITLLVAVLPGWLIWKSTESIVLAFTVGGVLGLISFVLPLVVVESAFGTFRESVWTLVYRELISVEEVVT